MTPGEGIMGKESYVRRRRLFSFPSVWGWEADYDFLLQVSCLEKRSQSAHKKKSERAKSRKEKAAEGIK